ncbi:MAG: AI-2E family transporter [Actinomycetota bacterium]
MSEQDDTSAIERYGRTSWFLIGIVVFAGICYSALAAVSGLVVPLVLATTIGILGVPLVDGLERRRIPRPAGALLVMLGLIAVLVGSVLLAIDGIIEQGDEITRWVTAGIDRVDEWLESRDGDLGVADDRFEQARQWGIDLLPGAASWFTTIFSSVVAFLFGAFLGFFLLYYILVDWERLRDWVGRHLSSDDAWGAAVVEDAISTVREGFAALTASSLVTAVLIGGTMVVLDLPLAFVVTLVTFVTSYVPYLGAIFSAVFACLVALGAGEFGQAVILLVVILIVQNIVQTVIGTKLTSDRLSLHPIAGLTSTIVGASLAGLLGATLSAPVLATILRINARRRDRVDGSPEEESGRDGAASTDG